MTFITDSRVIHSYVPEVNNITLSPPFACKVGIDSLVSRLRTIRNMYLTSLYSISNLQKATSY